jgi:inhibitor of cysteine peptidase
MHPTDIRRHFHAGIRRHFHACKRRHLHTCNRPRFHAWQSFLILLLVFGGSRMVSAATRVVTDADKGANLQISAGDSLEVHLNSNPSTGYMWYVHPQSTTLLKLVGQSQTQPTQPGVGRPIMQEFRFQASQKGDGVLLLHYVRSWEKPSADEEQFSIHVTIK